MNTGITRIMIVAALAVAGFAVLVSGFSGSGTIAASGPGGGTGASPSVTVSPPKSPKPSVSPNRAKKIEFFVLNGTTKVGAAADWEQHLSDQGLTPALNAAMARALSSEYIFSTPRASATSYMPDAT